MNQERNLISFLLLVRRRSIRSIDRRKNLESLSRVGSGTVLEGKSVLSVYRSSVRLGWKYWSGEVRAMAGENGDGRPREEAAPPPPPPPERGDAEGGGLFTYGIVGVRPMTGPLSDEDLQSMTRQFAIKGFLFTAVGVVAILFPFLFGLAIEQLLAWLLVLGGGITLVQFLLTCGTPGTASFLLLGALHFAVGLWLLLRPIEGLAALTFVLTGWIIGHGILKLVLAYHVRHLSSWPAVLVSGLISIALGIFLVYLTPTYGLQLLGIVFGADLLSTGISVLMISLVACIGRGRNSIIDAEQAREPLLQGHSGIAAAPSA